MRALNPFALALAALALTVMVGGAYAASPGRFIAAPGQSSVKVKSWGPDCGPRPQGRAMPGGRYLLDAKGHLSAEGRAFPLAQTGMCAAASGLPSLKGRRSGAGWRCASPAGASKVVKGTAKLRQPADDPNRLHVSHTFSFDWRLKGSHCQVDLTSRWTLTRETPLVVPTVTAPPTTTDPCANPGAATALVVKGSPRRLVPVGGRIRLSVTAKDPKGCAVTGPVIWQTDRGKVGPKGRFRPQGMAIGDRATLKASQGRAHATFTVRVVSAETKIDPAGLVPVAPGLRSDDDPVSAAQAGERLNTTAQDGVQIRPDPGQVLRWSLWGLAGLSVLIVVGVIVIQSRRRRRSDAESDVLARLSDAVEAEPGGLGETLIAMDGDAIRAQLRAAGVGTERATPTHKTCPTCGALYPLDARHCGVDGTPLTESQGC